MQKKLIAAAIAGLVAVPALAQTNVTISGHLRAGYDNYSVKDCATPVDCRSESKFSDQNSRIIFNIVEDLGGGLKAWGQLDSRFTVDQGGQSANGAINWWAQGNTGMGLMHSSWGKVTLGHWDVYYNEFERNLGAPRAQPLQYNLGLGIMSQVFNPAAGGTVNAVTVGTGTRTSNLLMWDSPNWNGFTATLGYSTNPAAIANEGSGVSPAAASGNGGGGFAWTGAIRYNNGPWAAGYAHWTSESEVRLKNAATGQWLQTVNDLTGDRVWLGYSFAMGLKLGIGYDRSKNDAANAGMTSTVGFRRSAWYIPVSYSWGPHAVYASYAKAGDASNTAGADTGASAWNLGYDYAFSKRTSMGIYYTALSNKGSWTTGGGNYNLFSNAGNGSTAIGGASTGFGADARQWYIGMAHSF